MIILAHRGLWRSKKDRNTPGSFKRAFGSGFGVETDIRDHKGELVISHDIPDDKCMKADVFFKLYRGINNQAPLALNIKADGLNEKLKKLLVKYNINNYFVFDMSVPDALGYLKLGIKAYTRQSEYETVPSFYGAARGVWIDCFQKEWVTEAAITGHISKGKMVCLVSPELHKREYLPFWRKLANMKIINDHRVMLCTDHPEEAGRFFNGED